MRDDYVEQLPDVDLEETTEWLDSLDSLVDAGGERRARFVLAKLTDRARALGVGTPVEVSTPYINTIPAAAQEWFPGDVEIERKIRSYIRWNAAVMVVNANHHADGIGGRECDLRGQFSGNTRRERYGAVVCESARSERQLQFFRADGNGPGDGLGLPSRN